MLKALVGSLLGTVLLWGELLHAQPPPASKPTPATSARKDPRGVKGISPFWESINKGDRAFNAHDLDAAIAAYQDATTREPQNALGHYRMGEAQLAKGDLHEAETAFVNGLSLASADSALKAKLQFSLADLRERQKTWDDASAKWTDYETFSTEKKVGFPGSGSERKRAVETWKKLSSDSAEVKARIQKGIAAADEAMRKSSK